MSDGNVDRREWSAGRSVLRVLFDGGDKERREVDGAMKWKSHSGWACLEGRRGEPRRA